MQVVLEVIQPDRARFERCLQQMDCHIRQQQALLVQPLWGGAAASFGGRVTEQALFDHSMNFSDRVDNASFRQVIHISFVSQRCPDQIFIHTSGPAFFCSRKTAMLSSLSTSARAVLKKNVGKHVIKAMFGLDALSVKRLAVA